MSKIGVVQNKRVWSTTDKRGSVIVAVRLPKTSRGRPVIGLLRYDDRANAVSPIAFVRGRLPGTEFKSDGSALRVLREFKKKPVVTEGKYIWLFKIIGIGEMELDRVSRS